MFKSSLKVPIEGSIRYSLARSIRKFSKVLQDNCPEAIYQVEIYSVSSEKDEDIYGKDINMVMSISNLNGCLQEVKLNLNTMEGKVCASSKFYTIGRREVVFEIIKNALYDLIDELDVLGRPVSAILFDTSERYNSVYYTEDLVEKGSVVLTFSAYSRDYAGLPKLGHSLSKRSNRG